ncbi:MAG TPA: D-glycero-beta-D-manno-heptose 1-phosphate adenylyltransferase [Balneolaceae bacterium]|nr:D-glycero-beta-D-manno-heptose 1-phosphate adenylyltransferase [Balneolaceae bacterium]
MLKEIREVVEKGFTDKNVIVIGDLMLDKYITGEVTRVSPEAPVPVVQLADEKQTLGGAGNVALNLCGLGISVDLISVIGNDVQGEIIKNMFVENELSQEHISVSPVKPTITKTRIVGEHQQIVRVDREDRKDVRSEIEQKLTADFNDAIQDDAVDAVIISDYAKGTITDKLCKYVIEESNDKNIPVLVDPKGKNFDKYKNATILIPNEKELSLASHREFKDEKTFRKTSVQIRDALNLKDLVVTLGERGILHFARDYTRHISTRAREAYDVSGAGDTVIALVTAGLISYLPIDESLELANMAAGYVVSKTGTHPMSYAELNDLIHRRVASSQKIFYNGEIKNRLHFWQNNKQKIVFTNGCFDIIHTGHIHLLEKAKEHGDKLVVGINTDESVRMLKGDDRPVNNLEDRIRILESITYVDAIIPFSEATPLRLIQKIQPDVLVKGADYEESEIVGAKEVKARGGEIVRIPLIDGKSTSRLIQYVSSTDG